MRGNAKKRLLLTRLPPILCLHVKRLFYDPLNNGMAKSLQHILFPEELDLGPYSAYAGEMTGQWTAAPPLSTSTNDENSEKSKSVRQNRKVPYRLMSVIEHRGNAHAGHYVCYRRIKGAETNIRSSELDGRRSNEDWVVVSDQKVSSLSFQEVQRCQAYMLFYEAV